MQNHSIENKFDLHENEPVGGTYFHMNGFAQRLVDAKDKSEWPIAFIAVESAIKCSFV